MAYGYHRLEIQMQASYFAHEIGTRLKDERLKAGLRQKDLIDKSRGEFSKQTISKYENGERNIPTYKLMRYLSLFPRDARERILQWIWQQTVVNE